MILLDPVHGPQVSHVKKTPSVSELEKAQTQLARTAQAAAVGTACGALLGNLNEDSLAGAGSGAALAVAGHAIGSTAVGQMVGRVVYENALLKPVRVVRRHPKETAAAGVAGLIAINVYRQFCDLDARR